MLIKNLLLAIIFILAVQLHAQNIQNNVLISRPISGPSPSQQAMIDQLLQSPKYTNAICVNLNLEALENYNDFEVQFFENNYTVNNNKLERRNQNSYSWFGDNSGQDGNIILTVLGKEVQGIIFKGENMYKLLTLSDYSKAIVLVDQNQFPEGECVNPNSPLVNLPNLNRAITNTNTQTLVETAGLGCTMRALVMYTAAAEAELKSASGALTMENTIQGAIDFTNKALRDSEIFNYDAVELVLVQKTNYAEGDSMDVDLYSFALKDGDLGLTGIYGAMDEVHTLREIYDADFCALITTEDPKKCGVAADYRAVRSNAFFVVAQTCLRDKFTFAHELGHLLGCHHDKFVDTNFKYAFGHGYVDVPNRQRTIMAYNSRCSSWIAGGCRQIAYFSNPNVIEPVKNAPVGIAGEANNARVISLYSDTLFTFEQPESNQLINGTLYTMHPYASAVARQTISTTGNVEVQKDANLILKATQSIQLGNGFFAKKGSDVDVDIEAIGNCQ